MPAERVYLYMRQGSPGSAAARIGLDLKDLQWREAEVPVSGPEREAYLLMSPTGVLPCLEIGGSVVAGVVALLEYLDESYPRPPLMPRDPDLRAHVRQCMHAINDVFAAIEAARTNGETDNADCYPGFGDALGGIDRLLEREAGNYAAGRSMSLADPLVYVLADTATKAGIEIAPYVSIATIARHLGRMPGFGRAGT